MMMDKCRQAIENKVSKLRDWLQRQLPGESGDDMLKQLRSAWTAPYTPDLLLEAIQESCPLSRPSSNKFGRCGPLAESGGNQEAVILCLSFGFATSFGSGRTDGR